jgi:hypothetical protein
MELPAAIRNGANGVVLRIEKAELAARIAVAGSFWLFFDIKEGVVAEKFARLNVADQTWVGDKLKLANVQEPVCSGYGEKVIKQVFDDNKHIANLRRSTRSQSWRNVFSEFVDDLIWPLAASSKIIT